MSGSAPHLGICFSANQLYYAVGQPDEKSNLIQIGCFDFSSNVAQTIRTQDKEHYNGIYDLVGRLKKEFGVDLIRLHTVPDHECWSMLPKLAYDDAEEREEHLQILMKGIPRRDIEPHWYDLSNRDFKFLACRNKLIMAGFERLCEHVGNAEFYSDFEIGTRWHQHASPHGSFMTVCGYPGMISISSYLLGKFRGATYISFDTPDDLPYLWLFHSQHVKWLTGLHEHIYVYGFDAEATTKALRPFWDVSSHIHILDTVEKMQINVDETTYGFALERAFPAIMLGLSL